MLLAACSQSVTPQAAKPQETQAAEVEKETASGAASPTPAAAAEIQATTSQAGATPSPQPGAAPTQQIVDIPTTTTQPVTPVVIMEERQVELEWPSNMRLGDSDVIRLSLIPSKDGYQVTTDFPEHQTDVTQVQVSRPPGYELYAAARLNGVGFEISPYDEQEFFLTAGETASWLWSLQPKTSGQQRLTVTLLLRWKPEAGMAGGQRESIAYSRSLEVGVSSFFGMTRSQAMAGGLLGMILGGGFLAVGLAAFAVPSPSILKTVAPNPALAVNTPPGLELSPQETSLLRSLFRRYDQLIIQPEFLSGYSGARTFLGQPIRGDGRADAHTIVKIGQAGDIRREFENYERFVKDTLPPVTARIQHSPVTVRGSSKAALQYTFIHAPGQAPISLRQALQKDPDPALIYKVFETFGPNWWMQRRPYTFRLSQEYDQVLPTHLVLKPVSGRGRILDGHTPPEELNLKVGETVTLRNFPVRESRADGQSLSLLGVASAGKPALRVRWLGLEEPNGACGFVTDTRQTLLQDFVKDFDLDYLPDPLVLLPKIFHTPLSGTQATIHGDLNLENVLQGPGGFVWLIDFAMTRDGHTLYDFAHLSAEVIAHLIAPNVRTPTAYIDGLSNLLSGSSTVYGEFCLLSALRDIAGRCLFNPGEMCEFNLALFMACLGAMKFANLDEHPKHLLYLTAAYLAKDL